MSTVTYFIRDYILHFYKQKQVQYSINFTFHFVVELYLFHVFSGKKKIREHISNQTVHI